MLYGVTKWWQDKRGYRLLHFVGNYNKSLEGKPSTKNSHKYSNWYIVDPKKALTYLDSVYEEYIEVISYRDCGLLKHYITPDKEVQFEGHNINDPNECNAIAYMRDKESW